MEHLGRASEKVQGMKDTRNRFPLGRCIALFGLVYAECMVAGMDSKQATKQASKEANANAGFPQMYWLGRMAAKHGLIVDQLVLMCANFGAPEVDAAIEGMAGGLRAAKLNPSWRS